MPLVAEGPLMIVSGRSGSSREGRAPGGGRGVGASAQSADGAAGQAAWVLGGGDAPDWLRPGTELREADPVPAVREPYAEVRELTADGI